MPNQQEVVLIHLDEPAPTGAVYTLDSLVNFKDPATGEYFTKLGEFYGEVEPPDISEEGVHDRDDFTQIEQSKVCMRVTNVRLSEDRTKVLGTVEPYGPQADVVDDNTVAAPRMTVGLRGNADDPDAMISEVVKFHAFDRDPIRSQS